MFGLLPEFSWMPMLMEIGYIISIIYFIMGIKYLSSPATARKGNNVSAIGMLIGIIVVLLDKNIVEWPWILAGIIIGSAIGLYAAKTVAMTSMPEMVALFNGLGGGASVLVAIGEFMMRSHANTAGDMAPDASVSLALGVLIGCVTLTGSIVAYLKLSAKITGKPVTFPGLTTLNMAALVSSVGLAAWFAYDPSNGLPIWIIAGLTLVLGVTLVLPIGGADMPVVISLLNSYSGLAAAATGFIINNNLLIVTGALVGASGIILTQIMCKAMNRSLTNVLFGNFGATAASGAAADAAGKTVKEVSADDLAVMIAYAQKVVVVPGYGLAVAQAQHAIREVAAALEGRGVEVKYGIHPVAGRMPGHMNVLLAEANVPYPQLYDMDDINPEMETTDVVLVIGANDVVNPDARNNPASPIFGMPIINVDKAKNVIVFKRSMNPGYAGIENMLFFEKNTFMFFGDAKKRLTDLLGALKNA
jgi:NAD(P) transhydrogenase subunit beta